MSLTVVALGVGVGLVSLFFLTPGKRSDFLAVGGFAISLVGVLVRAAVWFWGMRRPVDLRPVDTLAGLLAHAVQVQWRKEATERVLVTPAPIPVSWSLSDLPVAGPVEAAVGARGVAAAFPPLPGRTWVSEGQLRCGGGRSELFGVYAGITSGRVLVVGAPGSGKTGTAVLLLLDALAHRDSVDEKDRGWVPVPVLLTAHGWDPNTCSAQDWLTARLAASYSMFQHRGGQEEAAALVAAGSVSLILDGLDEMDAAQRPVALQALSDAPFRVVVLSRSREMIQAASAAWLVGAAAVQLRGVTWSCAADYLERARTGPAPLGWTQLLTYLRKNQEGILTGELWTPLELTLIRDTYRAGDDISDLLNDIQQRTGVDLAQHLIARVLPDAYTPRPGRPAPRYSLTQAKQVLTFLARQMNQDHTRDLAWWQISQWAPTIPRILASVLAAGLLGGLFGGVLNGLIFLLGDPLGAALSARFPPAGLALRLLAGLAFGLGVGFALGFGVGRGGREPTRLRNWRAITLRSVLTAGVAYGLLVAIAIAIAVVLAVVLAVKLGVDPNAIKHQIARTVVGVGAALLIGLTLGLPLGLKHDLLGKLSEGGAQELIKSEKSDRVAVTAFGIVGGVVIGVVVGIAGKLTVGVVVGLGVAIVIWLLFWLIFGLIIRLAGGFVAGFAVGVAEGESRPQGPLESWRNDRVFGLVAGIAFGLANGLVSGLFWFGLAVMCGNGVVVGFGAGFGAGLIAALVVGIVYGITFSATWSATLAWLQLKLSRQLPAVGLMAFLEDSRNRGVLRTVGAVYQFRHAILQDQLVGQTTATPVTSSAS